MPFAPPQTGAADAGNETLPFFTFLWKVASRCNLDCAYCYVYHHPDQRWRRQPKLMTEETARQVAQRIREHLQAHGRTEAAINFHGGEPLMGGPDHLRTLVSTIHDALRGSDISVTFGLQTNGLLFTSEIGDTLLELDFRRMGVSVDGPPEVNDVYRVDHQGRPTSAALEERLEHIFSGRYDSIFKTILCVINPTSDPLEVNDYLGAFRPEMVDYLFPLDNHSRLPPGKEQGCRGSAPYGEWLITIFDDWWARGKPFEIRFFDSILQLLCGAPSMVESLGLDPVDLIVVETNGEIEAVDSLKSTFDGATELGLNVFEHDFDTAAHDAAVQRRQIGVGELCETCRGCPVVEVCGGGYLPHRYASATGFDNPSVFCLDLEILIRHIHQTLQGSMTGAVAGNSSQALAAALGADSG